MSGVSVRPRPRLPSPPGLARAGPAPGPPYNSRAMHVTTTPAPEVLRPARGRAAPRAPRPRHRRRRPRACPPDAGPGFRPGKAPRSVLERVLGPGAVLDEAVDHLVQDAYREAIMEQGIVPLTNPNVEVVQAEEGKPFVFTATVQVRPEVTLGDYALQLQPRDRDDRRRQGRPGHRRAARPERHPRAGRGPRRAERRLRRHRLRRDRVTACRSRAARRSGCRSSSARSA